MSKEEVKPKIGEGHAAAMGRLGLAELRNASYPDSNVTQHTELGLYGTKTSGEITAERRGDSRDARASDEPERKSVLAKYDSREHDGREGGSDDREPEKESRGMDRE